MTKKNKTSASEIKQSNLDQTIRYSDPNKYKVLKYKNNPTLDELYKDWNIKPDRFSKKINVSSFFKKTVVPYMKYFDSKYESPWENQIYNLTVDINIKFDSIAVEDIRNGKYLSINEDKDGKQKIAQKTENSYLSAITSLDSYNMFKDLSDMTNLDWLIYQEDEVLKSLITQSNNNNWTLATFNNKIKAIRRYYLIMLGANHELRIKYSILYGALDYILQLDIGNNRVGDTGDDLMYFKDLLNIVDYLEDVFQSYYTQDWNLKNKNDINKAFSANMNFLAVACFVWDYPSRTDKYETFLIKDPKEADKKETYLVNDGNHLLYWIYRKDIKAIGRPHVVAPMEAKGLEGDQKRLNDAIKLSLKLFPRNVLFASKTINWKKEIDTDNLKPAKNVSDWVRNLSTSKIKNGQETNHMLIKFPKLVKKNLGVNLFRRSFVTHWIEKMNHNEKKKMVHAMLTSFTKIETHYKRKFDTIEDKVNVKLEFEEPEQDNTTVFVNDDNNYISPAIPIKQPMTNAERQKKYYANKKNDKEFQEKRKNIENNPLRKVQRVVRELNQGKKNFKMMFKSTIDEYKISFNPTTKLYSSSLLK